MLKQISAFYANALVTEGIISIEDTLIIECGHITSYKIQFPG